MLLSLWVASAGTRPPKDGTAITAMSSFPVEFRRNPSWHLKDQSVWRLSPTVRYRLLELGGDSTWTELPDLGIRGNTHALMMEDNSDEIADLICDWIREHVK